MAMVLAFIVDDDHPLFRWHMLFGIAAVFLAVIRLVLGLAGSRYARFSSFPLRPREVAGYMVSALTGKTKRYPGNNPGSAVAAVLMLALVPLLFATGVAGDAGEEVHELFAWGLLSVVLLHLAGLAWHTFRHRENIALAMITGRKEGEEADAIPSAHVVWGGVVLVASLLWIGSLFASYDSRSGAIRLPLTGLTLQPGEGSRDAAHSGHGHRGDD